MLLRVLISLCLLLGASFAQGPGSLCSPNVLRELAVPADATNTGYTCQSTLFYTLRLTSSASVSVDLEDALAPTHNRLVVFAANAKGSIFAPEPGLDITPANDTEGSDSLTAQLGAGDYYIAVAVSLEFFTPPPDAVPFTLSVTVDPASARGTPSTAGSPAIVSLSAPITLPADGTASVSFMTSTYEFIIYALVALPNVRANLYDASGALVYYNGNVQLNQLLDPPGFAIGPGSYSVVAHGDAGNTIRIAISRVRFDCTPTADLPPMQATPGLSDLLVNRSLTRDITLPFTETFGVCIAAPRPFYSPVGPDRRWFHFILTEESSVTLSAVTSQGLAFDAAIAHDVNGTTSGLYTEDLPFLYPFASNRTSSTAVLTPGPYFIAFGGFEVDPAVTLSVVVSPISSASSTTASSLVISGTSSVSSVSVSASSTTTSKSASTSIAATTSTTGTGSQFPTGGSVPGSGFTIPPQPTTQHPITQRPSVPPSATLDNTPTHQTQSSAPPRPTDDTTLPSTPGPEFASDARTLNNFAGGVLLSIVAILVL